MADNQDELISASVSEDKSPLSETAGMHAASRADVRNVQLGQLLGSDAAAPSKASLDLIMDIEVPISVELGRTQMPIGDILELGPGSIVEMQKMASDPVDLLVNNKLIARGEVVVVDENFGIRITSIIDPRERVKSLA
ncbi:MAG TPA: flagellar motor switch protein FliN [Planctomycetota bacterium]|nr:flagellar motor switch protein FliN [Planctomycetota bacterium]